MLRPVIGLAVIAVSIACSAGSTWGQEGRSTTRRPPSLSERLEQFRTDLLGGEPIQQGQPKKSSQKKPTVAKPRGQDDDLQPSTARVGSRLSEPAASKKPVTGNTNG